MTTDDQYNKPFCPQDTWPLPMPIAGEELGVALSTFTTGEKQILWRHLKRYHGAYARWLVEMREDAAVNQLFAEMGATFSVPRAYLPASLKGKLTGDKGSFSVKRATITDPNGRKHNEHESNLL